MSITERIGNLRQLLPGTRKPDEDERLLQLFWNRAELKKEFAGLQDERYSLLDKLKKQEGNMQRLQEHMEQLQDHLGDPALGGQSLVYFQLRRLWKAGSLKLTQFALLLRTQQEERERRRQLIEFDQQKRRASAEIEARVEDARAAAQVLDSEARHMEQGIAALRGFWNYFRRRRAADELSRKRLEWDVAMTVITDLGDEAARIESEPAPAFPGISIDGRRVVNTATIAYAQYLVGRFSSGGLAMRARETTAKRVYDVHYGSREECGKLMGALAQSLAALAQEQDNLSILKELTDRVRTSASYRSDADTIPLTDSIGLLPVSSAFVSDLDAAGRSGINVLVDDYWDVYQALIQ